MTEAQADRLAEQMRAESGVDTRVEREGHYFVVAGKTATGTIVVRDEADWRWLRKRLPS
jgi:hypothetical protein